jgi:hypothetical protein
VLLHRLRCELFCHWRPDPQVSLSNSIFKRAEKAQTLPKRQETNHASIHLTLRISSCRPHLITNLSKSLERSQSNPPSEGRFATDDLAKLDLITRPSISTTGATTCPAFQLAAVKEPCACSVELLHARPPNVPEPNNFFNIILVASPVHPNHLWPLYSMPDDGYFDKQGHRINSNLRSKLTSSLGLSALL